MIACVVLCVLHYLRFPLPPPVCVSCPFQYLSTCLLWKLCGTDTPEVRDVIASSPLIHNLCDFFTIKSSRSDTTRLRVLSLRFLMFLRSRHTATVNRLVEGRLGKGGLEAALIAGLTQADTRADAEKLLYVCTVFLTILSAETEAKHALASAGLFGHFHRVAVSSEDPGLVLCALYAILNLSTLESEQVCVYWVCGVCVSVCV